MVEKYPNLTLPKLKHLSRHTVTQHRHASKVNSHGNGSSNFTPIFPNRTENNLSKNTWNKMAATVPSHPRWHLLWQRNTYETLQQQLRKMKEQFFGLCVHVKRFNGINYFWEKKEKRSWTWSHACNTTVLRWAVSPQWRAFLETCSANKQKRHIARNVIIKNTMSTIKPFIITVLVCQKAMA